MSDDTAEGALLELAGELVNDVANARIVELIGGLPGSPRSPDWRTLTPRQLGLAEAANPDYAAHGVTPDRPGAKRHCDYCGSARAELVPGADGEDGAWLCRDERQCLARKEHRYPPRPDLVPEAVLSAVGLADQHLLPRQPAAAQPAPVPPEPPESQQEPAAQEPVNEFAAYGGWYDRFGQWHAPGLPQFNAYSHTIAGGAHTGHLLSGQPRPHYYGGPHYIPMAVYGAESSQEAPVGQPAGNEIPAEGLAPGQEEALHGGGGVDVQLQQPQLPEAAPQRPARRSRRTRWR